MSRKKPFKIVLITFSAGIAFVLILDLLFPFRPELHYSTQIVDQRGAVIHAFLNNEDKWRLYSDISEITPLLRKTLIFKEDQYFYYHPGINPVSAIRALGRNLISGKITSGASTITMQVVRLIEPRKRTYLSKLTEMWRALQLEIHYSKDEILLLYLNLVPYGGNIEGIKAASLLYFGKMPQLLSLAEITALTIVPNRPAYLRPGTRNEALRQNRNLWLGRFGQAKLFEPEVIQNALEEPLTVRRLSPPRLAPHLALRLKNDFLEKHIIKTTIHIGTQARIEKQVGDYINRLRNSNIHNAAVLVVNNETMQVEAYVASADFENTFDGGQVDGIRAVRSPGSTLKPLLYAAAFDKGIITPKTVINDVPGNFNGYEPENFDQRFNGPVSAEFALANSLNMPAVRILKETGTSALIGQLKKAGFKTIDKQSKELGLSMILGGCGVTLEELTRLFAAFSNEGTFQNLRYTTEKTRELSARLVSKEAAYLVTGILSQITRPDLPSNFDNTFHLPRIAWKTGTSYGKRDAWSIGYNRRYTVGVWVGNFSGAGVPELSGANTATPLLFSIFNALDYNSPKGWYQTPENISLRKVCPVTGDIPSDFCDHQVLDQYIVGVSAYRKCRHQRIVFTDPARKISYCSYCVPEEGFVQKTYPDLAPELIAFYDLQKIPYQQIPPHNPLCERVFDAGAPLIVSPNDGSEYFINQKDSQKIQLACQAANDVDEVFWYVNDKLAARAAPNKGIFLTPPPGRVKISCSDDRGRNTDIWIVVRK